ncbi:dephospho-CoA kinase [Desertivirga arenae]|uniref:dephospho-CoA kinase n=1 Tax=Desertivirga arenae TaxID=2810309 RepID=UPI001A961063|nr:dephospho-CoA kinase [Pedobacter sp. SYSU D00823]
MLRIGITGGIGSGKTTICKVFEIFGIPVFYADIAAKSVMQNDPLLVSAVKDLFGDEAYFESGELNRSYLAAKVFGDEKELKKLNSIVHPAVFRAFDLWSEQQKNVPYVLKEAALLYESNSYQDCSYTILVKSPLELKLKRVMQRDNVSGEEIRKRMARQWTDEEKEKLADIVLNNNETYFLLPEIIKLHQRFLEESTK